MSTERREGFRHGYVTGIKDAIDILGGSYAPPGTRLRPEVIALMRLLYIDEGGTMDRYVPPVVDPDFNCSSEELYGSQPK